MFGLKKLSLGPVPDWLTVQRTKDVFYLSIYDSINDMKYFWNVCITPQLCHSHFCCWLLPIWPKLDFWNENGAYGLFHLGWRYNGAKRFFFKTLYFSINDMKYFQNCLHHTTSVPQPFLLLIAANLTLAEFLAWKWCLWHVLAWLVIQQRKFVFLLTLRNSINDMKYFRNCLHHISAVPQPFLLLIAANLAQDGFLGWKWSFMVCAGLVGSTTEQSCIFPVLIW